ncbi:MAG: hypothetical protein HRT35_29490, partial [Algicola sp.]|nr:hypothetical protein [Algicola sp.]
LSQTPDLTETLAQWSKQHLPAYMCPDHIIVLEQWPLTAHGKLNTQMLPMGISKHEVKNEPPIGDLEQTLAEIWRSVLNQDFIYRETHFFSAGGHSLIAAIMASRIREKLGYTPDIHLIFREPTLTKYAQALAALLPDALTSVNEDAEEKEEFVI